MKKLLGRLWISWQKISGIWRWVRDRIPGSRGHCWDNVIGFSIYHWLHYNTTSANDMCSRVISQSDCMWSWEWSVGVKPGAMWDHMRCGSRINDDGVLFFYVWLRQQVDPSMVDYRMRYTLCSYIYVFQHSGVLLWWILRYIHFILIISLPFTTLSPSEFLCPILIGMSVTTAIARVYPMSVSIAVISNVSRMLVMFTEHGIASGAVSTFVWHFEGWLRAQRI